MKKKFLVILFVIFTFTLSACNFTFPMDSKIKAETLNHISTVVMNANVKINTSTYKIEFFQRVEGPVKGSGSGFIIHKETVNQKTFYYVLTNSHVINLDKDYRHEYKIEDIYNNLVDAELVAENEEYDLAILKFQSNTELQVVELASENPQKNQTVFSVGSPSGKQNIITAGKIVGYTTISNVEYEVIVHEAFIHKGSSGSMLIDESFKLVGINTWGFVMEEDNLNDDFVKGGATPIDKILYFLETIEFDM